LKEKYKEKVLIELFPPFGSYVFIEELGYPRFPPIGDLLFCPNIGEEYDFLITWGHIFLPVGATGCFDSFVIFLEVFVGGFEVRKPPEDVCIKV